MIYLTPPDLLHIADRVLPATQVADPGLLDAALARPRSSALGTDAYPTVHTKAAALLHSLANNHALVDGNKRLALAATIAFLGLNGHRLALTNDEAYNLVMSIASGHTHDVATIAQCLRTTPVATHT